MALASNVDLSGAVAAEARIFNNDPGHSGQSGADNYSFYLQPELRYKTEIGRFTVIPFYRHDNVDDERSHFDFRELNWRYFADRWDVSVGVDRVFWGVTESRHLIDIINQTDLVENIDQEVKLGQPMIRFNWQVDWGVVTGFLLPGFRERTFPGINGRLRTLLPVASDAAVYESDKDSSHVDFALRYNNVIGDWDVGAYYFTGTSREPRLITDSVNQFLIPYYDQIQQVGIDAQLTMDSWLWKIEGINRHGHGEPFSAVVAGFEYTLYQVFGHSADLGLLGEWLYDGRDVNAPPTLFDRDLFLGLRLSLNDVAGSEVLVGLFHDEEKQQRLIKLEGKRRLTQNWSIELEAWRFQVPDNESMDISQDNYIQLQLIWNL
ncbi:MAG: hypothetical protein ABW170_06175 [Candidatus Thiodiazotropha sp. L084R]